MWFVYFKKYFLHRYHEWQVRLQSPVQYYNHLHHLPLGCYKVVPTPHDHLHGERYFHCLTKKTYSHWPFFPYCIDEYAGYSETRIPFLCLPFYLHRLFLILLSAHDALIYLLFPYNKPICRCRIFSQVLCFPSAPYTYYVLLLLSLAMQPQVVFHFSYPSWVFASFSHLCESLFPPFLCRIPSSINCFYLNGQENEQINKNQSHPKNASGSFVMSLKFMEH